MRGTRAIHGMLMIIGFSLCTLWVGPGCSDAIASDPTESGPADVEALMALFARSGGVRAVFRESRQLSILTDPIESSGKLFFAPPEKLARHTTHPGHSRVVIEADRVSIADETGQRVLEMGTSAVARALVTNLMIVFRGDLESLRSRYTIAFTSTSGGWVLDLDPRSSLVGAMISRIRFTGRGRRIETMETFESNGDRTIMTFSDVEIGITWEESDLERLFSVDSPDLAR